MRGPRRPSAVDSETPEPSGIAAHGARHGGSSGPEGADGHSRRLGAVSHPDEVTMQIEREHVFDVPVSAGFAYITDPANWTSYWPGIVRVEPGSRWASPGDEARLAIELLGREVELRMTLRRLEADRLVEYDSVQDGLPDARHERHFESVGNGFRYRLVVEYEPRPGLKGLYDRLVVRRGVERALRQTLESLEQALPR